MTYDRTATLAVSIDGNQLVEYDAEQGAAAGASEGYFLVTPDGAHYDITAELDAAQEFAHTLGTTSARITVTITVTGDQDI